MRKLLPISSCCSCSHFYEFENESSKYEGFCAFGAPRFKTKFDAGVRRIEDRNVFPSWCPLETEVVK